MTASEPVSFPDETPDPSRCARPSCGNPVIRNPIGRPRLYCSTACRTEAYRAANPDQAAPLLVEVDIGSTSSRGRPAGQVWLVRLRRGNRRAIVAIGLGRPSAETLAAELRDVINPPPLARPPRIR